MSELPFFVVCRAADEPLLPGYTTGFRCLKCGRELQLSPRAVEDAKSGGAQLVCGLCFSAVAEQHGISQLVDPLEFLRERARRMRQADRN